MVYTDAGLPLGGTTLSDDTNQAEERPLSLPQEEVLAAAGPLPVDVPLAPAAPAQGAGGTLVTAVRELLETVVFALLVFMIVQALSRNYMVQSISMQPNLYEGQRLVVNRLVYATGFPIANLKSAAARVGPLSKLLDSLVHSPRRGEVIVFVPVNGGKPDLIKRVIGIEGDNVELRQGKLYINGKPIDEPYIRPAPSQSWGPATVGKGQIFVMGDNRGSSSDPRVFGMLPLSHVVGHAWIRYWPPHDWGFIRHYDLAKQISAR